MNHQVIKKVKFPIVDTNADKFQSILEANNTTIKSGILSTFKIELQQTLNQNNNTLLLKISTDLDQKYIQFKIYL